jgi:hypothetical protein
VRAQLKRFSLCSHWGMNLCSRTIDSDLARPMLSCRSGLVPSPSANEPVLEGARPRLQEAAAACHSRSTGTSGFLTRKRPNSHQFQSRLRRSFRAGSGFRVSLQELPCRDLWRSAVMYRHLGRRHSEQGIPGLRCHSDADGHPLISSVCYAACRWICTALAPSLNPEKQQRRASAMGAAFLWSEAQASGRWQRASDNLDLKQ